MGFLIDGIVNYGSLVAQASDPISGGAGWVGTGLLGSVLGWLLLKYLPDKDKQLKEMMSVHSDSLAAKDNVLLEKDKMILEIMERKEKVMDKIGERYTQSLQTITEHCRKETQNLGDLISRDLGQLTMAVQDLSEVSSRFWASDAKKENHQKKTMKMEGGKEIS